MTIRDFLRCVIADARVGRSSAGAFGTVTALIFRLRQLGTQGSWPVRFLATVLAVPLDLAWVKLLMGSDLPGSVKVGAGLSLPHGGRMLSINPKTVIGSNVTIQQHVILGNNRGRSEAPIIGDDVFLGPRATVLGGIRIGDKAQVGAHSVVLSNVEAGMVVGGIPARTLGTRGGSGV